MDLGFILVLTSWAGQLLLLLIISHIFHKKWFKPPILLYFFFFLKIKFVILTICINNLHLLCPHWALDGTRFSSFPYPVVYGNNCKANPGYYWFLLCLPIKELDPSLSAGQLCSIWYPRGKKSSIFRRKAIDPRHTLIYDFWLGAFLMILWYEIRAWRNKSLIFISFASSGHISAWLWLPITEKNRKRPISCFI